MKHLGDITKINGSEIEPVDCVCFGSPCQDLSVAGLRKGLEGERSGLFMEAVRIIKEIRENELRKLLLRRTDVDFRLLRPRYAVWENVVGALSSNRGEDFRVVLEELARVRQPDVAIPRPNGKWSNSGFIFGDNWSIAWRTVDARFWGSSERPTPQRRRRIALVTDFGGHSASKILFECESLSRNYSTSRETGEGVTTSIERSTCSDNRIGIDGQNGSITGDCSCTITGQMQSHTNIPCCTDKKIYAKAKRPSSKDDFETWVETDVSPTLNVFENSGGVRATVLINASR